MNLDSFDGADDFGRMLEIGQDIPDPMQGGALTWRLTVMVFMAAPPAAISGTVAVRDDPDRLWAALGPSP